MVGCRSVAVVDVEANEVLAGLSLSIIPASSSAHILFTFHLADVGMNASGGGPVTVNFTAWTCAWCRCVMGLHAEHIVAFLL